jgi:hypothetical protein
LGVLCQTRGCGTPPLMVSLQSKYKLLDTLSVPSGPIPRTLHRCVLKAIESIPSVGFTGLATKASINVTTASCWEHNRKEYGTLAAINEIVSGAHMGITVPERDLNTLVEIGRVEYEPDQFGTYLFWACLDECMKLPIEELYSVSVVMVDEPGKSRAVTKGRACLKVILDVLNKICSSPLRHLKSSHSGMGKANHGWNFFNDLFQDPLEKISFDPETIEIKEELDNVFKSIIYKELWASSTDFTTATDYMNHNLARLVGTLWLQKLGIPKGLAAIALRCLTSRYVHFKASGPLVEFGEPVSGEIRRLKMVRGILMGDPLTKVILHIVNASIRHSGNVLPAKGGLVDDWQDRRFDPTSPE